MHVYELFQGVLDAYRQALDKVELHGPTQLNMILEKAMEYAKHSSQNDQHYQILLIITVSAYVAYLSAVLY